MGNRLKWKDVRQSLREEYAAPPMPESDAFWEEFRKRAGTRTREAPVRALPRLRPAAWAPLAAAAALVLLATLLFFRPAPQRKTVAAADLSQVEAVDVYAEYSSLMIMQDRENGGTLIWLAGVQPSESPTDG